MTKRKTKAQREEASRLALWQRIYDVVCGACGREFDEDYNTEASEFLSLEEAQRAICALDILFRGDEGEGDAAYHPFEYLFRTHNLGKFECAGTILEHLYEAGVRA